jgi:hypothetical protein
MVPRRGPAAGVNETSRWRSGDGAVNRAPTGSHRAYSRGVTRVEWIAGSMTLPLVVAVSLAVDAALGFALGLVAFPIFVRAGDVVSGHVARPAHVLRGRASAADG